MGICIGAPMETPPIHIMRTPTDPFGGGAVYHSMSLDGYFSPIPGLHSCFYELGRVWASDDGG